MSTKAVLVDFGLSVQMTEDIYYPKDLRGTEVRSWRDKSSYITPTVVMLRLKFGA